MIGSKIARFIAESGEAMIRDLRWRLRRSANHPSWIANHNWPSSLPLFVARVLADHADHVLTLYDAAGLAKALDWCSYFHGL